VHPSGNLSPVAMNRMKKQNIGKQLYIELKNPHESINATSKKKNIHFAESKMEDISSGDKSEPI
jgi:hypothetical protein